MCYKELFEQTLMPLKPFLLSIFWASTSLYKQLNFKDNTFFALKVTFRARSKYYLKPDFYLKSDFHKYNYLWIIPLKKLWQVQNLYSLPWKINFFPVHAFLIVPWAYLAAMANLNLLILILKTIYSINVTYITNFWLYWHNNYLRIVLVFSTFRMFVYRFLQ